jgi:hypothetical protein
MPRVSKSNRASASRKAKGDSRAAKRRGDHRPQEVFDLTMHLQYMSAILF